jgi:hypothetical protein
MDFVATDLLRLAARSDPPGRATHELSVASSLPGRWENDDRSTRVNTRDLRGEGSYACDGSAAPLSGLPHRLATVVERVRIGPVEW